MATWAAGVQGPPSAVAGLGSEVSIGRLGWGGRGPEQGLWRGWGPLGTPRKLCRILS